MGTLLPGETAGSCQRVPCEEERLTGSPSSDLLLWKVNERALLSRRGRDRVGTWEDAGAAPPHPRPPLGARS